MPVLFATVLIDLIGFGMVIPILPFAAPRFGASELDIALLIVVYSVFGALLSPLWGRLSDRFGRKKILLTCLAGGAVSYVLLGFAQELWMLYAVRILAGCFAGNFGVASAMAADISTPQNRAKAMGLVGAAFGLGMVAGPFLGGLLSGPEADLLKPSLVAATLSLLAFLAGAVLLRETVPAHQTVASAALPPAAQRERSVSQRRLLADTGNAGLILQYLILTGAISTVSYVFPLAAGHYLGWGPYQVGIVFGIQGLAMAIIQGGLTGRLVDRYGEMPLLRCALVIMLGGFALATVAHTQWLLLGAFFITVTGASFCTPVLNTLLSKRSPLAQRGRLLGIASAASAWGRVIGPLAAGLALAGSGYASAWLVGAAASAAVFGWLLRTRIGTAVTVADGTAVDAQTSPAAGIAKTGGA